MKRLAQKSSTLSLVPTDVKQYDSGTDNNSTVLRESFDSWLNSVAPSLLETPVADARSNAGDRWRSSLTSRDVTRVNRATVRESSDHRHWPPEVVMTFLAADVIKPSK
jgi:hypothetical protein